MRPLFAVSAAVAFGVLAVCGPAAASPQFDSSYKLKLTTAKPATSSGWSARVSLRDPGDVQKRPKILSALRIKFPKGTRFDARGHAACRSEQKPIVDKGPAAVCPPASRYGSGQASVIVGTAALTFPIRSFNFEPINFDRQRRNLLLDVVIDPNNPALTFLIPGYFSRGGDLFFDLPLAAANDIHTTLLRFGVPASRRGKRVFMRTPATCPRSRRWTASVVASFADRSKETRKISLPCRRR